MVSYGINNQFINLLHYGFAFTIVFILWPRVLFSGSGEGGLGGFFSRYVKMVFLVLTIVYVLVLMKLYELISVVVILLSYSAYRRLIKGKGTGNIKEAGANMALWLFDIFDGVVKPSKLLIEWGKETIRSCRRTIYFRFNSTFAVGNTLLFIAVLLCAAYFRFYDTVMHAAPAMSDSYVTLAWMKYIDQRILFHDGIYPQGFHIYLSVLRKFAATDALYVLKYTGPLNGVLTTLGIYFVVSRFTGRTMPGIISAFIYGVLGSYLHFEWQREAATNSQEFALVFLLPAWYFAVRYFNSRKKTDFWAAAACFIIIGWVHTLVFGFLGTGLFFLIVVQLIFRFKESLKPACQICLAGVAAGAFSVLPVLCGILMGKSFHSQSAEFLTQKLNVDFSTVMVIDQIALAGFILFFIVSILTKKHKADITVETFLLLLGISSFAMYMTLGHLTGNALLATRLSILWGLLASIGVGVGWYAMFRFVPDGKNKQVAEIFLCAVVMACAVVYLKPAPAQPYKMQYDSMVNQYLRISDEFRPTEWTIVSEEEGYDLALGRGWHIMLGDFLTWYNPANRYLARLVDGQMKILDTPDIFIFKEKNVFMVNLKEMQPILARREKEYQMLDLWLEKYRATHDNMSIYYEDADIQIIHIDQKKTRDEVIKDIWGSEKESNDF